MTVQAVKDSLVRAGSVIAVALWGLVILFAGVGAVVAGLLAIGWCVSAVLPPIRFIPPDGGTCDFRDGRD